MTRALEHRTGLPDALRVLLKEHPREAWEADPNFNGLISFWLNRHVMFRKLGGLLIEESQAVIDNRHDADRFSRAVGHYGGMLVNQLHGHHQIEDAHYFPVLATRDKRIEKGFDLLDADHHALDGHLNRFVDQANAAIKAAAGTDPRPAAEGFLHAASGLNGLLLRHLEDEEDLIVPVILRYGTEGLG
ncbi:MAG: hemerythrin domain-containing protein [Octadecabacter sp.]|nr:hemerythrin domain-containing protein [Octadecabacter sp.]